MPDPGRGVSHSRGRPPPCPADQLPRPRITGMISDRLAAGPVLLVTAPTGFGKTAAVAEWAQSYADDVAWVTLGIADTEPGRIDRAVLAALTALPGSVVRQPFSALDMPMEGSGPAYDTVAEAVAGLDAPATLVVDDAHRGGDALSGGLLGSLIDGPLPGLRVLVIGTDRAARGLSRFAVNHPGAVITAGDLAFDAAETAAVLNEAVVGSTPTAVYEDTGGWPVAVSLLRSSRHNGSLRADTEGFPDPPVRAYIRDHVLAGVPAALAEFALHTAPCPLLTGELAVHLTGRADAARLLEACVDAGLFLDRAEAAVPTVNGTERRTADGTVYRWHRVFARHCRALDAHRNPDRAEQTLIAAAAFYRASNPLLAARCLLEAGQAEDAVQVILSRWVGLVVGATGPELDSRCASLPSPWNDDPRILAVRACVHHLLGSTAYAQLLSARAHGRAPVSPESLDAPSTALTDLFLIHDRASLRRAVADVREWFATADWEAGDRAGALYLLGWTELRLRSSAPRTVSLLSAAADEARALGEPELESRALDSLAYAFVWAGRIRDAERAATNCLQLTAAIPRSAYVRGGSALALSTAAYWRGDFVTAARECNDLLRLEPESRTFTGIARMTTAFVAAASRDSDACRRAAAELTGIPARVENGISWPAFRHAAIAILEEAMGRRGRAMRIVSAYRSADDLPMVVTLLAGIAARAGQIDTASQMLHRLNAYYDIVYVRVMTDLVDAQSRWHAGHSEGAHRLIAAALESAVREDLRLPFMGDDANLRLLLTAHLTWGTPHEDFLVACLAAAPAPGRLDLLSDRERQILGQLRTTRTMQEIADRLGLSINTVKTHQRAIYRKLGVSSRREAIRLVSG